MIEVTCAIIMKGDDVLITQRSESMQHPLRWEFPGGKMNPGESPERCIKREIKEELHVDIKVDRLLPSVVYDYGFSKIKLIPFVCRLGSGEIQLREHKTYAWIGRKQVKDYDLLEADIEVINVLNGRWK